MGLNRSCEKSKVHESLPRIGEVSIIKVMRGGQMVSVIAFCSDDPSLNPLKSTILFRKNGLKRRKINEKEAGKAFKSARDRDMKIRWTRLLL